MLNITKEKVLEAAAKCPQAKETLKTLFPEVFKDNTLLLYHSNVILKQSGLNEGFEVREKGSEAVIIKTFFASSLGGDYNYKAILLADKFNWERKMVDVYDILIPTRK